MKKKILIYGAGAIGRGFIPWIFPPSEFEISYVESDPKIRDLLNKQKKFLTFKTMNDRYEKLEVPIVHCYSPGKEVEIIENVDAVITAVGPRNALSLKESLINTDMPVICCENDSTIPESLRTATNNPNIVFGIPDVITSNTAPKELLKQDPLSIVTENGVCYIDNKVSEIGGNCHYVDTDELRKQWLAKLYIHNTPHCIAAYLGNILMVNYIHESMKNKSVEKIVSKAMFETEQMLIRRYQLKEEFVKSYSQKELRRFKNTLLFDPIIRVAREPFRKLATNDRLISAAELCLASGIVPENVMMGIMAAFCYNNKQDPDFNITYLMKSLQDRDFLKIIIGLSADDALFAIMVERWKSNLQKLGELKNE